MISERLRKIILEKLALDDFPMGDSTVAGEVPGWDSLSHVGIITAVEQEYGIRLTTLEVIRLKTVGDLQKQVDKKAALT